MRNGPAEHPRCLDERPGLAVKERPNHQVDVRVQEQGEDDDRAGDILDVHELRRQIDPEVAGSDLDRTRVAGHGHVGVASDVGRDGQRNHQGHAEELPAGEQHSADHDGGLLDIAQQEGVLDVAPRVRDRCEQSEENADERQQHQSHYRHAEDEPRRPGSGGRELGETHQENLTGRSTMYYFQPTSSKMRVATGRSLPKVA